MSEGASIRQSRRGVGLEVVAVILSAVTLLITVSGGIWFAGRFAQRVDNLEAETAEAKLERRSLSATISAQSSDTAVLRSQYLEIISRLNKIDAKLDRR